MPAPSLTLPAVNAPLDDDQVFLDLDTLLGTALAMAEYFDRSAIANAIALAIEVNTMDYDGRQNRRACDPA